MRLITKLITALPFGLALAITGSSFANDDNELMNPGAEADYVDPSCGVLLDWDYGTVPSGGTFYGEGVSAGFELGNTGIEVTPYSGNCFFTFRQAGNPPFDQAEATEFISQDIDVWGCSVDTGAGILHGTYSASGFVTTSDSQAGDGYPDDMGTVIISFPYTDATNIILTPLYGSGDPVNGWELFSASGMVPADASLANFRLEGTEVTPLSAINVSYDNLHFSTNCVTKYAKVSGRAGTTGKGNEPLFTFAGAVGELEDGTLIGSIEVVYKNFNDTGEVKVCNVTPTENSTLTWEYGVSAHLQGWYFDCLDSTVTRWRIVNAGAAPSSNTAYYCSNDFERGCFGGNAPAPYRVGDSVVLDDPNDKDNVSIEKGNAFVF